MLGAIEETRPVMERICSEVWDIAELSRGVPAADFGALRAAELTPSGTAAKVPGL